MENALSQEKLRISRELHDNIGARLTFLIGSLEYFEKGSKNNSARKNFASLKHSSRETLEELRNTLWALKSEQGTLRDLILKIRSYTRSSASQHTKLEITIRCRKEDENTPLSSILMLTIFRIVQEALQNCIKHAHASTFTITFEKSPSGLSVIMKDNGKGFDVKQVNNSYEKRGSLGMINLRERAEMINAVLRVQSAPGKGTRVQAIIPLDDAAVDRLQRGLAKAPQPN